MDFEIKDLDIIDHNSTQANTSLTRDNSLIQNSIILKELHAENEELQNKLKINHRRLLLFETENNKLLEEKNKYFFEMQGYLQKNQLLTEKNIELTEQTTRLDGAQKLLMEKLSSLESINTTQLGEIRRFSKFHAKIQEVVKPLITRLKEQVAELKSELLLSQKLNSHLNGALHDLKNSTDLEISRRDRTISNLNTEKNDTVRTYEEQIHSFSKEILNLQSRNEECEKEITRLKKAIEFKNYYENEVIRFKRTHEEDQKTIMDLSQKRAAADARVMSLEQSLIEKTAEFSQLKTRFADCETSLDMTRQQLSKKIDELTQNYERLSRLEKLNNQLSQEMVAVTKK